MNHEHLKAAGAKLRQCRLDAGHSPAEVAAEVGSSESTIRRLETGRQAPSRAVRILLKRAFEQDFWADDQAAEEATG